MPGPIPKPAATRQRRNRTSTAAVLVADGSLKRRRAPKLPVRKRLETHLRYEDPLTGDRLDDAEVRRRRTEAKASGEAIESLLALQFESTTVEVPWHDLTQAWWKDVWRSPMADEFLESDIHGLFVLAELVDQYWWGPDAKLAAEIRQQRQCFGLTPIDRRRLQWEVQRVEAGERRPASVGAPSRQRIAGDPRAALRAIS